MKKKDWAILLLTTVYTLLFYHQHAGINFLLFTLLVVFAIALTNNDVIKNKRWVFGASLTILSAVFVFIYSSSLALLANCISLLLIASLSDPGRSSALFNLVYGLYSVGGSIVFVIIKSIKRSRGLETTGKTIFSKALTLLVPVIIAVLFLAIYKSANPLFASFTEKIDLSFISAEWLFFTFSGFLIAYGIVYHRTIKRMANWENNVPLTLDKTIYEPGKWDERKATILLFVMLNVMLFFINALDINYLYLGSGMPEGVTHKEFVHNGVGMLMLSILLGISTVLYFFRGRLNFDDANKTAKLLVYAWMLQNLMMVISTAFRNHLYITEALLTYKRIGVYSWLVMAAAGLITTCIKLAKAKPAWYLFSANSMIAYVLLVLSAGIDWDKLITDHNMASVKHIASLDKKYLISLSESNLAQLYSIKDDPEFNTDSLYHYHYYGRYLNSCVLDLKLYEYLKNIEKEDWRSYNLRKKRILQEITALNSARKITSLNLSYNSHSTLKPVFPINNITELNVKNCAIKRLVELNHFKKIQKLNISGNNLVNLDSLPELKQLTHLYIANNSISGLTYLSRTPALKVLDLSENDLVSINDLPMLRDLEALLLDGNKISDLARLQNYPLLRSLSLGNYQTYLEVIPELPALTSLNISGSAELLPLLSVKPPAGLTYLDLSKNKLKNTDILLFTAKGNTTPVVKFENLQELDLNNNELYSVAALHGYKQLRTLDVSNNKLVNVNVLAALTHLEKLYMSNNHIYDLDFIDSLEALKELRLCSNNRAKDFLCLKRLSRLEWLDVSYTGFNDLTVITSPQLKYLNLKGCALTSLSTLGSFSHLETLFVSHLKQADAEAIQKLTHLKNLHISETSYDIITQLQNNMRNTEVKID